jgi:hypothetical protein
MVYVILILFSYKAKARLPKIIAIALPLTFIIEAAPVKTAAEVLLAAGPVGTTDGVLVIVALPPAGGVTTAGLDDTEGAPEDDLAAGEEDDGTDEDKRPLQNPLLQVLKAHCWLLVHWAWKLPQRVWRPEFVA